MIVCDAGFPIPSEVWRVDLALVPDVPDLETVSDGHQRRLHRGARWPTQQRMAENNPPLLEKVKRIFADAEHSTLSHEEILGGIASQAKVIVRTGAFDPWGNILLYSGVDVPQWFAKPGTKAPDYYADKL